MEIKMVSSMKYCKDRMSNPMELNEIAPYLTAIKDVGATHIDLTPVIGHPNFVLVAKRWANAARAAGLDIVWRPAHQNMEGLYGAEKYVGTKRKPEQFWIDEAVSAVESIKSVISSNDYEAFYPERTEGIFQDSTSFLPQTGLPKTYGDFFVKLHDALKIAPWKTGYTADNGSEFLSRWRPAVLSDYAGVSNADHYRDNDPDMFYIETRLIHSNYGKPVFIQESAPNRFSIPNYFEAKAHYDVCKRLDNDGILWGYGSWSGWSGTPESIFKLENGEWKLTDNGVALKEWWTAVPNPEPTPTPGLTQTEVKKLYQVVFHRPADTEGLIYWTGKTLDQFMDGVLAGDEYKIYEDLYDAGKKIENWARNN